jgi:hypothetical protein
LKSAYEMSMRTATSEETEQPKKVERKVKVVKKGAEKRRG